MILGCVADDFTGASDLANTLAQGGMATTLYAGVPEAPAAEGVQAGVVALKSRTIPPAEAVAQSLAALDWLQAQGALSFVFKYCSTFDSTDAGNIGPVAEAMMDATGAARALVCPAFPGAGRTVYQGHLFVGDRLLSESGMENHPLTPMRDPDIRRALARQSRGPVGHVPLSIVERGPAAVAEAMAAETQAGRRLIVADALTDAHLIDLGAAAGRDTLITGGSGVATGLPGVFLAQGLISVSRARWEGVDGPGAAVAGSVSRATQAQVAAHRAAGFAARTVTPEEAMAQGDGGPLADELADWAAEQWSRDPAAAPLIYTTADPEAVSAAQARHGREALSARFESLTGAVAAALLARGARRLVSAGGETSGAVVAALGLRAMAIGPEIDPGVPALKAEGRPLALALKSGNFGGPAFFAKALAALGKP
ncbi:Uncharacterized conserved protein YgbK, DUF1537 family [Rubrimonas cliftonensis]|uniref:3-oxo-tetronate kinase n=2 Tax=Rubrimonas cliftonensis TaxID=89524 RepID=A0A1H4E595_9RHOB|nr:3-oxo-tetronate kinase [Rubrimonas cliftonensis]SEA79928.1 Uncharacterized conserved protein YgbK, DUF1537 family [Rubrimonas cliftonensis]